MLLSRLAGGRLVAVNAEGRHQFLQSIMFATRNVK